MHQTKHLLALFIALFLVFSCETEKVDLTQHDSEETITSDSPLFEMITMITTQDNEALLPIACVDFVYPVAIIVYDENRNPLETTSVWGDAEFSALLGNLPENNTISISYPISTSFADGTLTTINSNTELKLALDSCAQDEIIEQCEELFAGDSETCGWQVPYMEGYSNTYASGYFKVKSDKTMIFYYNNEEYIGTWNYLYLNQILHLNINLAGNSPASEYWNHNYKIIVGETSMEFAAPSAHQLMLKKKCQETETYGIGDNGPAGGIVFYDKGSYSNGWRYIEVNTEDLNASQWGCPGQSVPQATNAAIGSGYLNATRALNFHNSLNNFYTNPTSYSSNSNGTVAAKEALNLVSGGNDDWFLPTSEELHTMYSNLHLQNLGNFSSGNYWSSTQSDADHAKTVDFSNGNTSDHPKSDLAVKSRAIRYF